MRPGGCRHSHRVCGLRGMRREAARAVAEGNSGGRAGQGPHPRFPQAQPGGHGALAAAYRAPAGTPRGAVRASRRRPAGAPSGVPGCMQLLPGRGGALCRPRGRLARGQGLLPTGARPLLPPAPGTHGRDRRQRQGSFGHGERPGAAPATRLRPARRAHALGQGPPERGLLDHGPQQHVGPVRGVQGRGAGVHDAHRPQLARPGLGLGAFRLRSGRRGLHAAPHRLGRGQTCQEERLPGRSIAGHADRGPRERPLAPAAGRAAAQPRQAGAGRARLRDLLCRRRTPG
mmetsp:Transcript_50506/g.156291  ORF Transcript_50506/g.156291 Transcript_50506/m.156291 type:complete len:287 (+) Transcript_50506:1221-2081(+)